MDIEQYLDNHLAIKSCGIVDQLCAPLKKLGITYFSFVRIYDDHSRISLCNHTTWQRYFYLRFLKGEYKEHHVVFERAAKKNDITVWRTYPNNEALIDASNLFDMYNGVVLAEHLEDCNEICHFAVEGDRTATVEFCMNHTDLLRRFIAYFKEQARELIMDMEQDRIIAPEIYRQKENNIQIQNSLETGAIDEFLMDTQLKRYYLPSSTEDTPNYLTQREYECLNWLARGKSAWEIGQFLGISKRTVEVHIERIKTKMNAFKLSKLIYDAITQGLILPDTLK